MKNLRQAKLLELVGSECIETQEALIRRLSECHFPATQATVSRDIRELRLVKALNAKGTYQYVLPGSEGDASHAAKLRTIFHEGVTSCRYAQNIVIIKTLPGLAAAAAAAIDVQRFDEIAGTLAGDDTVFLAAHSTEAAEAFTRNIRGMME